MDTDSKNRGKEQIQCTKYLQYAKTSDGQHLYQVWVSIKSFPSDNLNFYGNQLSSTFGRNISVFL